ncbi:DUF1799 domain-containing protein [Paraburkholderia phytofirmans]|uniref:Uncharacterized protein n=1 Tax=Paraburkholderia phytofirmans (strain DSM 17436 / LMG 22146 / PsJN) TaxID=398527 RepID=B2T1Y4_PARPJ|nr:DUF1799 domain-containing protein [Paraburkholderia phytofirmans]ACD15595.1 Protein of unknown function DUF1799 phage-related [Paraburkholderia phytofirmans PsJN]
MAAFGAPADVVEVARSRPGEDDFEVLPENWDAVEVFTSLGTQWKKSVVSSLSGGGVFYEGLDYSAVESVFRMFGFKRKRHRELFDAVRVMERAALDVLSARASRT